MQAQVFHILVIVLFVATFGEASLSKIFGGETPEWFRNQFKDSWMGKLPQPLLWWSIALMELAVAGVFVAAAVRMEFLPGVTNTFTEWGCLGSMFIFISLLFGQRVSLDYAGAANSFFYAGLSGGLWYFIINLPK